jgi:GTPase
MARRLPVVLAQSPVASAERRSLEEELPYAVYVEIALYEERAESVFVAAIIWVGRNSHKAIVIGRSGNMLKKIGSRPRASTLLPGG